MATSTPSIIVLSNNIIKSRKLLELITKNSEIKEYGSNHYSCMWTIDTKYYTADVSVHGVTEHYQCDKDFNENIKAIIIHTDCNSDTELTDSSKWDRFVAECDPEVKLLISDHCNDTTKVNLTQAGEWCRKRGFEFVVLYPNIAINLDQEVIVEKVGVDRIVEVLQTCIWPNMQMKNINKNNKKGMHLHNISGDQEANNFDILDDMLADEEMDDFAELFGQLHMMKESISSLSEAERKHCAEQMVTAFWKAIGGDDDELQEL